MRACDLTALHGGQHVEVHDAGFHAAGRLVAAVPAGPDWVAIHLQADGTATASLLVPATHDITVHGWALTPTRYTPTYQGAAA
ncbi:hypothetical protein [Galactobacter valiniphilus]|uniref:hypothetical protein n=1 Tax=Galactobacter valiniphilus TaxID=2676122 RepID=UPI003735A6E6